MIRDDHMSFLSSSTFMFQIPQQNPPPCTSSNLLPSFAPPQLNGVSEAQMSRSMPFPGVGIRCEETIILHAEDDMSDDGSQQVGSVGEKNKRLSMEQVKALEKSFELGEKLEPERKLRLARAVGLQPRQVAIWFQNRRARWKTKQLEKEYELLKRKFGALQADHHVLETHNKKLHAELLALKSRESAGIGSINLNKETHDQGSWSNGSDDNSCENLNLGTTRAQSTTEIPFSSHHHHHHHHHHHQSNEKRTLHYLLQQGSSRSDPRCDQKIDRAVRDESVCNMFSSVEDQPGFWPWPEQQQFQ